MLSVPAKCSAGYVPTALSSVAGRGDVALRSRTRGSRRPAHRRPLRGYRHGRASTPLAYAGRVDCGNVKVRRPLGGATRCVWTILAGLVAIVVVAACGASRSLPHSRAHTLSCGLNATPASLVSRIAAASPGQVVCLASGDYSSFTGTSKSAPGITITSAPGATVTFDSGIRLNLSSVQNFTLDGTGGGGTMTVGGELDMETTRDVLQDKPVNLTFQHINFAAGGNVVIEGPENSNITFNRDTFVDGNANTACTTLGAQFFLLYQTATATTLSGVTVENSVFVAPRRSLEPE